MEAKQSGVEYDLCTAARQVLRRPPQTNPPEARATEGEKSEDLALTA